MNGLSNFNLTCLSPQAATIALCILLIIAVFMVIRIRKAFPTKIDDYTRFKESLTPAKIKEVRTEEKKKYKHECVELTVALLKQAVIKKTYRETIPTLSQYCVRKLYTIPLNKKEAVMYIWGKVIATSSEQERDRVIRMAALILGLLEENKEKHILELEAMALCSERIYGEANGDDLIQIRAVSNVDGVFTSSSMFLNSSKQNFLFTNFSKLNIESVGFYWPRTVKGAIKKLKKLSLLSISSQDLMAATTFPCSICRKDCSIFELENLKCTNCR